MKKVLLVLSIIIFSLFCIPIVHAGSLKDISYCDPIEAHEDGTETETCYFQFEVDGSVTSNQNDLTLTLTNVTIKSISLGEDWYYTKESENILNFETSKSSLTGKVNMATITFQKINNAEHCEIKYACNWQKINRSCTIYQGNFYNSKGEIVSELDYKKDCEKPQCYEYEDGTYSGIDGSLVSKLDYEKQCKSHSCEKLSDGTLYGKNGNIVTEEIFNKECNPTPEKHMCEIIDDKFYDKLGNETTELEYQKQCETHSCEKLSDGTLYGKNGNIVTEEIFDKECNPTPEKHMCEIIDGKFYDKLGNEITKLEYQKQCETHSCEILSDGTRYDKNGNVVNSEAYEISCGVNIENPQTGEKNISRGLILFGILLCLSIYFFIRKNNKIYHL